MNCNYCNAELSGDSVFCPHCGKAQTGNGNPMNGQPMTGGYSGPVNGQPMMGGYSGPVNSQPMMGGYGSSMSSQPMTYQAMPQKPKKAPTISWICCGLNLVNSILVFFIAVLPMLCLFFSLALDYALDENHMDELFGSSFGLSAAALAFVGILGLVNIIFFIYMLVKYWEQKKHFGLQWTVIIVTVIFIVLTYFANVKMFDGVKDLYTEFVMEAEMYEVEEMTTFNEYMEEEELGFELPYDFFAIDVDDLVEELEDLDEDDFDKKAVEKIVDGLLKQTERAVVKTVALPVMIVLILCGVEAILMIRYKEKEAE